MKPPTESTHDNPGSDPRREADADRRSDARWAELQGTETDGNLLERLGLAVARLERAARDQERQMSILRTILFLSQITAGIAVGALLGVTLALL